jgi:hypothetical protein
VAPAVKKTVPMCCVTIGYTNYLLPADKGMKVVELMQSAFECNERFGAGDSQYEIREQPRVGLEIVRPNQIVQPRPAPAPGPRLLEAQPSPVLWEGRK